MAKLKIQDRIDLQPEHGRVLLAGYCWQGIVRMLYRALDDTLLAVYLLQYTFYMFLMILLLFLRYVFAKAKIFRA